LSFKYLAHAKIPFKVGKKMRRLIPDEIGHEAGF
jgi:hypothetical protein